MPLPGKPLCFPMAGRKGKGTGRRCEGLCSTGACSSLGKSPGTRMMHWRSAYASPVLPADLSGASPATGTLYPQNRFPPARLFPWKRQSDSGLWDQLENTTVSSDRLRSAGVSVPGRRADGCGSGQGCLPARQAPSGTEEHTAHPAQGWEL